MSIPDYLTYFFREGQVPLQTICDLDEQVAESILRHDTLWRGDGTYLAHRKQHERYLRDQFIAEGGQPVRQHPIYMILGDSPKGPHDLHLEYDYRVTIPLAAFPPDTLSFTYPDSLYTVPLDDLGRLYLDRNTRPTVYRLHEIAQVVETYKVYQYNNHYVEAQVWDDAPARPYVRDISWQRCR
jgi:hypothetical protein